MGLAIMPIVMMVLVMGIDWAAEGKARKARGDAAGALEAFGEAARENPRAAWLHDEMGFLLAVLRRPEEAIGQFEEAVRLDPRLGVGHYHLGVARWLKQEREAAIASLGRAVEVEPGNGEYRYRMAGMLYETGQLERAAKEAEMGTRLEPRRAEAWNQLGMIEQARNRNMGARKAYERAVALRPLEIGRAHV